MPKLNLRQQRFTYSACGPFTKLKRFYLKRIQNFRETGKLNKH